VIKSTDMDYSVEMACNLLSLAIRVGDTPDSRSLYHAENEDLRFALGFIENEVERYEKWPLEGKSFEDAELEFRHKQDGIRPLKRLMDGAKRAIEANEGEKRNESLKSLLIDAFGFQEEVVRRLRAFEAAYPGLAPKKRQACHGFMAPDEVLSRLIEGRKQKR